MVFNRFFKLYNYSVLGEPCDSVTNSLLLTFASVSLLHAELIPGSTLVTHVRPSTGAAILTGLVTG